MNLFTKYKLHHLKHTLKTRNTKWNYIKIVDNGVVKVSKVPKTTFETQVISYLVSHYNKVLGLDFSFDSEENMLFSPFVDLSILAYFQTEKSLFKPTLKILDKWLNTPNCCLNKLKSTNPIIDHFEVYCADLHSSNFFRYKNEFYLLDLEDFYFVMYDKDNNLLKMNDLRPQDQNRLIHYKDRLPLEIQVRYEDSKTLEYKYILI